MANESTAKPRVGLLIGDPCGIGPEHFAKVLAGDQPDPAFDLIVTTGHANAIIVCSQQRYASISEGLGVPGRETITSQQGTLCDY